MNLRGRVKKLERVFGPMKTGPFDPLNDDALKTKFAQMSDAELEAEHGRLLRERASEDPETYGSELAQYLDAKAHGPEAFANYNNKRLKALCDQLGIPAPHQVANTPGPWPEIPPEMFDD